MPRSRQPFMIIALLAVAAAGCKLQESTAQDASAIYGCYTARDAPAFRLSGAGMVIEGMSAPTPFRYEFRKVGYVIDIPLQANETGGRFVFAPGDHHFYRMVPSDAGPTFVVAFGPEAVVEIYKHSPEAACKSKP